MTRYLSGIRKQLQDVSDLFTARYGNSNIAEMAVNALVSATLLEHEMVMLETAAGNQSGNGITGSKLKDLGQKQLGPRERAGLSPYASSATY